MTNGNYEQKISTADLYEAEQHLLIALGEFEVLPINHEQLVEKMRAYFDDQRVEVFSRMVATNGEAYFRDFIAEAIIKTGKYKRDEQGQVVLA